MKKAGSAVNITTRNVPEDYEEEETGESRPDDDVNPNTRRLKLYRYHEDNNLENFCGKHIA